MDIQIFIYIIKPKIMIIYAKNLIVLEIHKYQLLMNLLIAWFQKNFNIH